jgi:predicted MFS family arabinose efflux permease
VQVRLSKPLYESLPWLYLGCGAGAVGAGYRLRAGAVATALSLSGLLSMVAAVAVWLRRRDFRARSADYGGEDQPPF